MEYRVAFSMFDTLRAATTVMGMHLTGGAITRMVGFARKRWRGRNSIIVYAERRDNSKGAVLTPLFKR